MRYFALLLFFPLFAHAVPSNCCTHANALGIACVSGVTTDPRWLGATKFTSQTGATGLPDQGDSLATVEANFPGVVLYEFQMSTPAMLNAQFQELYGPNDAGTFTTYIGVARFSQYLWIETEGNATWQAIMQIAQAKLNPTNLAIWNQAFDEQTQTPIFQSHASHMQLGQVNFTSNGWAVPTGVPKPTIWMTLGEIYDEYVLNGASKEVALQLTGKFAYIELKDAFLLGMKIGGYINVIGNTVDPHFEADIWDFFIGPPLKNQTCDSDSGCPDNASSIEIGDPFTTNDTGWCAKGDPSACTPNPDVVADTTCQNP